MSTARHHSEWLSLVEASGPFLSLPVLLRVFPQGLEAHEPEHMRRLRLAYEEWEDNQKGLKPDKAIHRAWVEFVLSETLELPESVLLCGQAIASNLQVTVAEQGETLRPDWVVSARNGKADKHRLLVQIYPCEQGLEKGVKGSRWAASPATRMMELLHACDVRLGLVTNGEHWLLVNAPKGETTGYISWYATLWQEENVTLRAFRSLLGVERFFNVADDETLEAMLSESVNSQQEVTDQLGFQVRKAVEVLVQAIDRIDLDRGRALLEGVSEAKLYEAALTVMMRLVFLFFAEENKLIPPQESAFYDAFYAMSTLRAQLREQADQQGEEILERKQDAWCRLLATFRAVYSGVRHDELYIPAYGGSLFDPDRFPFLEGRKPGESWRQVPAEPIPVNNRTVLHLLEALQILRVSVRGVGVESRKLSFRALDIEQIGHVYEGLLDHTAVRAAEPMLGLAGAKNKEPEVSLVQLEAQWEKGEAALVELLRKETGRSESALKKRVPKQRIDLDELETDKETTNKEDINSGEDRRANQRLLIACNNDSELFERVRPWAALIRPDTFDYPTVIPGGSVFVTKGSDRRETGTHYTPRSLTEEIVKYTLEPLVYEGVAEGKPKEGWQLKSAAALLQLKVCDMAMGSGAFLVQVCRYLSERLVEAWESAERLHPGQVVVAPEGTLAASVPEECPIPRDENERLAVARRIVADRCLYGVDKNSMAVEMAKLSLWLITLQINKPFTFLDHALRCGDSLLGVTSKEQIYFLNLKPDNEAVQLRTVSNVWRPLLQRSIEKRQKLESFTVDDVQDLARKEALQAEVEELTGNIKIAADYLIGEALADAGKGGKQKTAELEVLSGLMTDALETEEAQAQESKLRQIREKAQRMLNWGNPEGQSPREPFHWALEFPEVFINGERSGFDAIVGNPPFQGGKKITGALGTEYREFMVNYLAKDARGSADLCAYFFLRAGSVLQPGGDFGLIATNTIAQGDTREVGLDQLVAQGYTISRAVPSRPWPGTAALEVAYVWLWKGRWQGKTTLNDRTIKGITSFLTEPGTAVGNPHRLAANQEKSFIGAYVLGLGFTMSPGEAQLLIEKNPKNKGVLLPYLNGQDLNTNSDQSPSRWVINFRDWPLDAEHDDPKNPKGPPYAADYPDCLAILKEKVKPERDLKKRKVYREVWWQYAEKQKALYSAIAGCDRVLVRSRVANINSIAFVPTGIVMSEATVVFNFENYGAFAILQGMAHTEWLTYHASSMRTDIRYTPSDCFETFPFPKNTHTLAPIGQRYYTHRQSIMQSRQEGLTKTYNHFHDPTDTDTDIQTLRDLHIEMDIAVAAAYGWQDLTLDHGFHQTKQGLRFTISEAARREVLDRLLALNHQRYAEEVEQGLHDKKKKKKTSKRKSKQKKQAEPLAPLQGSLL